MNSGTSGSVRGIRFSAVQARTLGFSACFALALASGCWTDGSSSHSVHVNGYQFDYEGEQASRRLDGEIAAGVSRIEVNHRFGDVRIAPAADQPGWEWEVICWAATPERAREFAEAVTLTVEEHDGGTRWELNLPKPPVPELHGVQSRLTLHVPADVSVDVANSFGETSIEGVRGGTVARCEHGKLQLTGLGGTVQGSTSHAELIAERIGAATLSNEHGRIEATTIQGDLEAATSHSELRVVGVSGTARLRNQHGAVRASKIGGDLHAATSHAPIELNDVAGALTAENEHGSVTVAAARQQVTASSSFGTIDLNDVGGKLHVRNEHGSISGRQIHGDVNAASSHGTIDLDVHSPTVVCRNEHGGIELTVRSPALTRVEAETSFGALEVRVAARIEPRIEAYAEHGEVRSDFPLLRNQSRADNLRGLAEDVPRMTLRAEHGSVRVIRASDGP